MERRAAGPESNSLAASFSVAGDKAVPPFERGRIREFPGVVVEHSQGAPSSRRSGRFVPNASHVLAALDLVCVGAATLAVVMQIHHRLDLAGIYRSLLVTGASVAISMTFLYAAGAYRKDAAVNPVVATSRLPVALGFSAVGVFVFMHYFLILFFPADVVLLSISRCATFALIVAGIALCATSVSRTAFHLVVPRSLFRRRILVVGEGSRALYLRKLMSEVGHVLSNDMFFLAEGQTAKNEEQPDSQPCNFVELPSNATIADLARDLNVDEIVVAPDEWRTLPLEGLLACKIDGTPVTDYHVFLERETGRIDLNLLELSWLVCSNGFRVRLLDAALKRALDLFVSFLLLVICLPALVVTVLAIIIESPGPVLYRQERVTQGNRKFSVLKFRTMRTDAEYHGPKWSTEDDPRVTRVGRFLRRWRIDEVPQLFNVLRGDMSFVGPRPERPVFVAQLNNEIALYRFRHSVRSGLTGWAQINFRYGSSVEDARRKLEYDLYYIKNYSLLRDLQIILQTMRVVIWPSSAR